MVNFAALDLNLLRVFHAMTIELSTVRAGERIGLSQPAISSALTRLRGFLGDELFVREGNRMVPTPRALELREPVRQALEAIEEAFTAAQAFDSATSMRSFMLVGSDYFSTLLMPPLAAKVSKQAPGLTLHMVDYPSTEVFRLMGEERADIVIDRTLEAPEWIASQTLFRSWLVCAARQGHPVLADKGIRPGDTIPMEVFCAIPQVLRSGDGSDSGTIHPALARLGLSRRVVMTVPHFQAVALAVAQSDLLGSLPAHFAWQAAKRLDLELFGLPMDSPTMDVKMYWPRRLNRDRGHEWLREQIAGTLASGPPAGWPEITSSG